jgi:hypothetical protein
MYYRRGQVVYFHHLHSDKKPTRELELAEKGNYTIDVEGKSRPMLVLGTMFRAKVEKASNTNQQAGANNCYWYRVEARKGYLVLPITHTYEQGNLPLDLGLVEPGERSYVELRPFCYPVESICQSSRARVPQLCPVLLMEIEKELTKSAFKRGKRIQWYPA